VRKVTTYEKGYRVRWMCQQEEHISCRPPISVFLQALGDVECEIVVLSDVVVSAK